MKHSHNLTVVTVFGLLMFAAANVQAQVLQKMSFQLSAVVQGPTNQVGSVETVKYVTVRVTTKDILQRIENQIASPGAFVGATLVVVDFGDVEVRKGATVLANVTDFFGEGDFSPLVYGETFNYATGRDSFRGFWTETFTFDDGAANFFDLTGMTTDIYSGSAVDIIHGSQRVSDSLTFKGAGTGSLNGFFGIVNGTITVKGGGVRFMP